MIANSTPTCRTRQAFIVNARQLRDRSAAATDFAQQVFFAQGALLSERTLRAHESACAVCQREALEAA